MMRNRRSALVWSLLGGLALTQVHVACGGGAEAPPQVAFDASGGTAGGGTGGTAAGGSGGTGGGTGGTGGTLILEGGPSGCADPTDLTDSDGDGIADQIEGTRDSDGDLELDSADLDSDDDGILDADEAGPNRDDACVETLDFDDDDIPDYRDIDSDGDSLTDDDEPTGTACASSCIHDDDCDDDGVIDVVEDAAGGASTICDGVPAPNSELFFLLPFGEGPKTKRFSFSTGVKEADIYFLIDTTESMQPAITNLRDSLNSTIIPTILNGDATRNIPAIPGAWVGMGDYKDVPWLPWGVAGDDVYRWKYTVGGQPVLGNVSPPRDSGGTKLAPLNVEQALGVLSAGGGGDSPESTTQALWLAATNLDYRVTAGGPPWPPNDPDSSCGSPPCYDPSKWRAQCEEPSRLGRACFRPGKLPIFVVVTDAAFHNGPTASNDYRPPAMGGNVEGTRSYLDAVAALNGISAKVVGVSVNTGLAGQARFELEDLATRTGSQYLPSGATSPRPLVTARDTADGEVSSEVVRLIGLLAGQGLNNVTTRTSNYSCVGNVDCTGDNVPDPPYENPAANPAVDPTPFDATLFIQSVSPVPMNPAPYASIDATTFYGIRGDTIVEFEVTAENDIFNPGLRRPVMRALLRVQTPSGQALGGTSGVKMVYFLIVGKQEVT